MPAVNQNIGATTPKTGTFQYLAKRIAGLTLVIPGAAGVSSVTNRRIVSIQEDTDGNLFAVVSPIAILDYIIVGWGVLEEALQSGGIASIAPAPNTFVDGDTVVVLRDVESIYMIDVDPSNEPTIGIASAYLDMQGRISSVSSGSNIALQGAVFTGVPGQQLSSQLATSTVFFQLRNPLHP